MSHLLKSGGGKHSLRSTNILSNYIKLPTVSVATQTNSEISSDELFEVRTTATLATQALQAANDTQQYLAAFLRGVTNRLEQLDDNDSRFLRNMTTSMEVFAEDFNAVAASADVQAGDFTKVNAELAILNRKYKTIFLASGYELPVATAQGDTDKCISELQKQAMEDGTHLVSSSEPTNKRIKTAIICDQKKTTPAPIHGMMESASLMDQRSIKKTNAARRNGKSNLKKKAHNGGRADDQQGRCIVDEPIQMSDQTQPKSFKLRIRLRDSNK